MTTLAARVRGTGDVRVAFDDGGMRLERGASGVGHLPYELVRDVSLEEIGGLLERKRLALVVEGIDGEVLRLGIEDTSPLDVQRVALLELETRRRAPAVDLPTPLVRGAAPLATWLATLRVGTASSYRDAALAPETLATILATPAAGLEARAGAAHALLDGAEGAVLVGALVTFLLHALPPFVVLAAAATRGGRALVSSDAETWLRGFLTEAESTSLAAQVLEPSDFATAIRVVDPDREAAVAAALAEAKTRAEAELAAAAARGETRKRPLGVLFGGADRGAGMIGRSWAL